MKLALLALGLSLCVLACDEDKKATPSAPSHGESVAATAAAPSPEPSAAAPPPAEPSRAVEAPDAVAAQHVLVAFKGAKGAPKGVTRSKADAKARAEEVLAKAKEGADFSALVADYSDDAGSKDRMGSLGKFTRDKMVKPFSDAAFALQVGEVSAAVETDFGFHVIKRNQ